MKKIIILIILLMNFNGCEYKDKYCEFWLPREYSQSEIEVGEKWDYVFENSISINSIEDVFNYVHNNINYVSDISDYWQLPEETNELRRGDCEDMALLFAYLCITKLNINCDIVNIINGENSHIIIRCGNLFYEIKNYFIESKLSENWNVNWICPYQNAIWMTYYYHNNVGKFY